MVTKKHDVPEMEPDDGDYFREVSREEGIDLFDREAHARLGMSGEDFLRAWDAGEIDPLEPERHNAIVGQLMLLPLVGREWTAPVTRG